MSFGVSLQKKINLPGNAHETTADEDDEKVSNSNSEAAVDTYPGNANETTDEDSNSNSGAAVDFSYPGNANETKKSK